MSERWKARWPWALAWIVAIIYICAYASMIRQHKAIPYWDQSGYVLKTYNLVEQWNAAGTSASWWQRTSARIDPAVYLDATPWLRPPLLEMIPALVWRHRATPHEMAYTWLLCRITFLMAGAWVLSRQVGHARWVPAAIALTLASQGFLKLNQNVYLMDVPFACCALLAVALLARTMQRRSFPAALLAAGGTIALLLIKPQALAFMFPFWGFVVLERVAHEWQSWRHGKKAWPNRRSHLFAIVGWLVVLAALLAGIEYLLQSDYGQAAKLQYTLNTQGFWAHAIDGHYLMALLTGLAAPWMVIIAIIAAAWTRKRPAPVLGTAHWKLTCFIVIGAASWLWFNLFLSFGIDPRLVWSVSPLVVCLVCMAVWRMQLLGRIATTAAIAWFLLATAVTTGAFSTQALSPPLMLFGPPIFHQTPSPEIGLMPFVNQCGNAVRAADATPRDTWIEVLACDDFVEADAMNLAARLQNRDLHSPLHFITAPMGDDGFNLADTFDGSASGWFATKSARPTTTLSPSAFIDLLAVHSLITSPASPIHSLFDQTVTTSTTQPFTAETGLFSHGSTQAIFNDSLVLWHLRQPLNPQECRDAVAFILPRYAAAHGLPRMKEQLAAFEKMARQGTSVSLIDESELPAPDRSVVHNVAFAGGLLIRAAQFTPLDHAGLRLTLYWQATTPVDLVNTRFFHLNDTKGEIVRQADALQDPFRGHVPPGTLWRDEIMLTAAQLEGVTNVGIGIVYADGKLAQITPNAPATLDWKDQRLILPLPPH